MDNRGVLALDQRDFIFRTVPLLSKISGRVEETYVNSQAKVKAGQPIFKLDSSKQEAALQTARRRIAVVDAATEQAKVELEGADGKIHEAQDPISRPSRNWTPSSICSGVMPRRGGLSGIPPGSLCIANAYTNNHDLVADKNISTGRWLFLHVVYTVALVHALILRLQALVRPLHTLVFSGH